MKKKIKYCECGFPQSYPIPHEHSKAYERFKNKKLSIKICIDILEACYEANDLPYPMELGIRQSIEYLKELKKLKEV